MASKVAIEVEIKNIKQVADLKKSLKELRKETSDYEKEIANGKKATKESTKGYIDSSKAIKNQSKDLRNLKKDLSGSTKATKAATKSSNGMAKQFIKGAAAIGIVVGAFRMVSRALSGVVNTFTEFEFQMAKVKAITGASEQEFKKLSQTAQDLGRTTFFTAQQVAELQTNFAKLGFTTSEILNAQEATLLLATATGSDLARAAIVAGAAVRGFGLHASETNRVVDVMTLAFNSSALDIEKWQTSMTKVAPIAAGMNIEIEDTAAIMGTLTDAGIEASIAGTSMRNIFLKMKDSSSDLSKFLGFTVRSSDDLEKALLKLNTASSDTLDGLVNIRQVAAFNVMVKGSARVIQLTKDLKEAEGAAKEAASIIGDTLQGAFLRLTSATQGLSIELVDKLGSGLQDFVNNIALAINAMTKNSDSIVKMIKLLVDAVKWIGLYKLGTMAYTGVAIIATNATKLFNRQLIITRASMIRTGVGALVVGLGVLAEKFFFASDAMGGMSSGMEAYRGELEQTTKAQDKLNKALGEGLPTSLDQIQPALDKADKWIKSFSNKKTEIEDEFIGKWTNLLGKDKGKWEMMLAKDATRGGTLAGVFEAERAAAAKTVKDSDATIKEFEDKKLRIIAKEGQIRREALEKAFKGEKEAEDIRFRESIEAEQKKYLNSTTTKEEFDNNLLNGEITHLRKMRKIMVNYSEDISAIDNKIMSLRLKGQAKLNSEAEDKKNQDLQNTISQERIDVMKDYLAGTKTLKEAEVELRNAAISRAEAELALLPILESNLHIRLDLETKIQNLKMKGIKEEDKNNKKQAKSREEHLKDLGDLGSALQDVAGENKALNSVKKAGEAITKAAALAEALFNFEKSIGVIIEGKSTVAKLLGVKATTANIAATTTETMVETVGLAPKATSVILGSAKGLGAFGIIAMVAMAAMVMKVMKMFEDGGIIDDGNKFANGGMVHGASHANGGVKFAVGGRVNELEGGEAVINKRSTAMFRGQLSSMNEAGGGVKFADGGLLSSPSFTEANFNASNQSQMLGAMQGQRKVVVVEADITDSQSTVSVIQNNASF